MSTEPGEDFSSVLRRPGVEVLAGAESGSYRALSHSRSMHGCHYEGSGLRPSARVPMPAAENAACRLVPHEDRDAGTEPSDLSILC